MREVHIDTIIESVAVMCVKANIELPGDVAGGLNRLQQEEPWPSARQCLDRLLENMEIAKSEETPVCQDTGMACVFLEIGQDLHIVGGDLYNAVNEGVRKGYESGYLRKSIVEDPLRRKNTGDNTPAMIHADIVPGDKLTITVAPKGAGSENMSRLAMLPPSAGAEGVKSFVVETVRLAGPNPCPPIVVGVGIGGSFDRVAFLAKKALLRPLNKPNPDPFYAAMEKELLETINALGIGPQGFGGRTTALGVSVETFPAHIAGLPVAVNLNCHVSRHVSVTL